MPRTQAMSILSLRAFATRDLHRLSCNRWQRFSSRSSWVGCFVAAVAAVGEREGAMELCEGPYADRRPTPEELSTVWSNHQDPWESRGQHRPGRRPTPVSSDYPRCVKLTIPSHAILRKISTSLRSTCSNSTPSTFTDPSFRAMTCGERPMALASFSVAERVVVFLPWPSLKRTRWLLCYTPDGCRVMPVLGCHRSTLPT
jgi:hypothetical protein